MQIPVQSFTKNAAPIGIVLSTHFVLYKQTSAVNGRG